MLLFYGAFLFFAFNYPTPWRGWGSKYKLNLSFLCLIIPGLSARTE